MFIYLMHNDWYLIYVSIVENEDHEGMLPLLSSGHWRDPVHDKSMVRTNK